MLSVLRQVAAVMILESCLVLLEALEGGWPARSIALASTALLMTTRVNPIVLMSLGAVVFIAVHGLMGA